MRISGFTSRTWNLIHYTLLISTTLYCIGTLLLMLSTCLPTGIFFNIRRLGRLHDGLVCIDQSKGLAVLSAVHVVTDFALLGIPVVLLWKVQIGWVKKVRIGLAGIFGLGSCVCALLRTVTQYIRTTPDPTCKSSPISRFLVHGLMSWRKMGNWM